MRVLNIQCTPEQVNLALEVLVERARLTNNTEPSIEELAELIRLAQTIQE